MRRKSLAIANGLPGRINCFPDPNVSCLLKSVLNILNHVLRKTAHSWASHSGCKVLKFQPFRLVHDPIRGQYCYLSHTQIYKCNKTLISISCRYCGARIEINFDMEIPSPRTERTCHSVEPLAHAKPVQIQAAVIDHQNYEKTLGLLASEIGPLAVVLLLKVLSFL